MKILMTSDTVGGVWNYALQLAAALAPHGAQIHLATMGAAPDRAQCEAAAALHNLTLYSSTFELEWMADGRAWRDVDAAGEWLLALENQIAPDVVHLNGYAHGALPFQAPVMVVGHSCVLSWWQAVKGEDAP